MSDQVTCPVCKEDDCVADGEDYCLECDERRERFVCLECTARFFACGHLAPSDVKSCPHDKYRNPA